jgi:hypothetical protein
MIGDRRQEFVEVILLIHKQDLQDQSDRHHMSNKLLRSTQTCVVIPDQPAELDQREDKAQVAEIELLFECVPPHPRSPSQDYAALRST